MLTEETKSKWAGLQRRVISAVVLAALVIAAEMMGGLWFLSLIILAAIQMTREWDGLTEGEDYGWQIAGAFYVLIPCISILWLRNYPAVSADVFITGYDAEGGPWMLLYLLGVVWATDIGAYFSGRAIGGPKIAPSISPSKTWAGLGGGMAAAAVTGLAFMPWTPYPEGFFSTLLVSALLAVVAQAGDFFESWLKRRAGVKDSGTLIPGHGGLLDRVDGLVFAAPALVLLMLIFYEKPLL